LSNPFGIAIVANRAYVTDGGQNIVWDVDIPTGHYSPLASFPAIPNPVAPFGAPFLDAVPTGITYSGQRLLVALFRGFPFPPGTSTVDVIDPRTGSHAPFIAGLKTAIGVLPVKQGGDTRYLVLQHASGAPGPPAAGGPGVLTRVVPGEAPETLANCLARPTSMTLDETTGALYVTELMTGRVLAIDVGR
jgi:hypothetical protein